MDTLVGRVVKLDGRSKCASGGPTPELCALCDGCSTLIEKAGSDREETKIKAARDTIIDTLIEFFETLRCEKFS